MRRGFGPLHYRRTGHPTSKSCPRVRLCTAMRLSFQGLYCDAAEGGHLNVVRRLHKGQAELRCSVLTPWFLAFAFFKAADAGQLEVVEVRRSAESASVEVAMASGDDPTFYGE